MSQLLGYVPGTKFLMASTDPIFEAPKDRQVLIDGNCSVRLSYISINEEPRISRCVAFLNPSQ
jgi:hypothetical protein